MRIVRRWMQKQILPLPVHYFCNWIVRWKYNPLVIPKEVGCAFRFLRPWLRSFETNGDPLDSSLPWMTPTAVMFIEQILKRQSNVFEWGSGGSTLYWAKRCNKVVVIEHDKAWHAKVHLILEEQNIQNVDLRFVAFERNEYRFCLDDPSDPNHYATHKRSLQNYRFKQYASAIDEFPDEHFDIISVDGRSRPSCILHGKRKLRAGGHLILDNAARMHYQPVTQQLQKWPVLSFCGPVMGSRDFVATIVWQKPEQVAIAPGNDNVMTDGLKDIP